MVRTPANSRLEPSRADDVADKWMEGPARRGQGGSGRAENLLRRSRFSSLILQRTWEDPTSQSLYNKQLIPTARRAPRGSQLRSRLCVTFQVSVLLHLRLEARLVLLAWQGWCEMLSGKRTFSAQSHGWGWAVVTDGCGFHVAPSFILDAVLTLPHTLQNVKNEKL